jgi:hypothetical protein
LTSEWYPPMAEILAAAVGFDRTEDNARRERNRQTAGHHNMAVRLREMDLDGIAAEVKPAYPATKTQLEQPIPSRRQ